MYHKCIKELLASLEKTPVQIQQIKYKEKDNMNLKRKKNRN